MVAISMITKTILSFGQANPIIFLRSLMDIPKNALTGRTSHLILRHPSGNGGGRQGSRSRSSGAVGVAVAMGQSREWEGQRDAGHHGQS